MRARLSSYCNFVALKAATFLPSAILDVAEMVSLAAAQNY
jgi:hypothetical protein